MSSAKAPHPQSVTAILCRTLVPATGLFMIAATGVAVVLGCRVLSSAIGGERLADVVREYAWIIFWTGLAEGLCLLTGIFVFLSLSRRLTRPLRALATAADRQTGDGETARLPVDTPVAEINSLAGSFNRLFAAQEAQIRELKDLVSNILHDIRTPLTQVNGDADAIYCGEGDPAEAASRIIGSCRLIARLIDTNAEITRLNAGIRSQPARDIDLVKTVRLSVELFAPAAEAKSVRLLADLPPDPVPFRGHADKLQRLVGNLVDNALKFTPAGGSITLSLSPSPLRLNVADTGIGMAPETVRHVFERFYRGDASRHEPGFGLGLSLVKAIVDFYRGTITCTSKPGQGTVFSVTLDGE